MEYSWIVGPISLPKKRTVLTPGNKLNVVLREKGSQSWIRKDIEIALPPRRTIIVVIDGYSLQLCIVEADVNEDHGDAGFKSRDEISVIRFPTIDRNFRSGYSKSIDDDVIRQTVETEDPPS